MSQGISFYTYRVSFDLVEEETAYSILGQQQSSSGKDDRI